MLLVVSLHKQSFLILLQSKLLNFFFAVNNFFSFLKPLIYPIILKITYLYFHLKLSCFAIHIVLQNHVLFYNAIVFSIQICRTDSMGRDEKCGVSWVISSLEAADRWYVRRKSEESYKRQIERRKSVGLLLEAFLRWEERVIFRDVTGL